jgi:hypothetical protein
MIARLSPALLLCTLAFPPLSGQARDSAGVRIIENTKPLWTPGREWRLSEKPIVDIGSGPGTDQELGRIAGLTRLSDGRIVVADESSLQLKFYDASGRHLKSVGGKGQGPGEFNEINAIARLPGDTIAVEMLRVSTLIAPTGAVARTVRFGPFPEGVLQTPFVVPLGWFDTGNAVVIDFPQGRRGPAGAQKWVDSSSLFLVDQAGKTIRSVGKFPAAVFVAGRERASPLDFGAQIVKASSGRAMYLGFPDQYAIHVYNQEWKLERIIRRAWTPRRFTSNELDTYVDGWMDMWSKATGPARETERREMRTSPYAEFLPAYSALLATPTGELWVREPDLTGAPGCWCLAGMPTVSSKWSVFDPDGRWLGDVTMPPRMIPVEVGADYVLGEAVAADDVPHALMYRLEKPR